LKSLCLFGAPPGRHPRTAARWAAKSDEAISDLQRAKRPSE
jgi:hypothetical protein